MSVLCARLDAEHVEEEHFEFGSVFLVDLSGLGMSGLDLNVFYVHRPQPFGDRDLRVEVVLNYQRVVQSVGACFVIWTEPSLQESLMPPGDSDLVLLRRRDVDEILTSDVPASPLYRCIASQLDLEEWCPYNTTREARGQMFVGRRRERALLTRSFDKNYVLSGARRIGKTSLLVRSFNDLRVSRETKDRTFLINGLTWSSYRSAVRELAYYIDPRKRRRVTKTQLNTRMLFERASHGGTRPLLLFIDEIDKAVEFDEQQGWKLFRLLAKAAARKHVRVVFAGYRATKRLVALGSAGERASATSNSPFFAALEEVGLRPLTADETRRLVVMPFRNLGIELEDAEAVLEGVWADTLGYPYLVQFYCTEMFSLAQARSERTVLVDDVQSVRGGARLNEFLLGQFAFNTQESGVDMIWEQRCALSFANSDEDRWLASDFAAAVGRLWPSPGLSVVTESLSNLASAQILTYQDYAYTFSVPAMREVLRRNYPDPKVV